MFSPGLTVVIFLLLLVIITISMGVRIVPQGFKFVVQRLGKYHSTLAPGLNIIIPYMDTVAYINIVAPEKAVYGVEDYRMAIQTLVQTSLRSIVGEMDLDDALSSRDRIKARLKETISDDISDWGITLKTVEIQDINPSDTMQHAMEEQAAAERARRATVTRAEGDKSAAILQADGRLEASRRDAEAKVVLAEADREAIAKVAEATKGGELPLVFLLGQRYVDAMRKMAENNNSKVVVLPADLPAAVRGIMGTLGK